MKDFNLEKALAGEPVMTKSGKKVSGIYFFKSLNENLLPVVCVIDGMYHYYSSFGKKAVFGEEYDLCMVPIKKTIWVNVFQNGYGVIFTCTRPFETKERAEQGYASNKTEVYLGAYSIEVEI